MKIKEIIIRTLFSITMVVSTGLVVVGFETSNNLLFCLGFMMFFLIALIVIYMIHIELFYENKKAKKTNN